MLLRTSANCGREITRILSFLGHLALDAHDGSKSLVLACLNLTLAAAQDYAAFRRTPNRPAQARFFHARLERVYFVYVLLR